MTGATSTVHRRGESRILALLPQGRAQTHARSLRPDGYRGKASYLQVARRDSARVLSAFGYGIDGAEDPERHNGRGRHRGQVSGESLRMTATDFKRALERDGELRSVLQRFSQALMNQISQSVRGSVTVAAGVLHEAGLIRYTRGNLTVVDRRRLDASSCECYEVVRREFERLLHA